MVMPGKVRNSNIELLRIVSMLMIVILHFLMHGQILKWSAFGSKEYAIYWMIEAFVFVSVNAFVLISGYFLCLSEFKVSRLMRIWFQVLFYSIICTIFCMAIEGVSLKSLVKAIVPLTAKQYWFATTYVLMILFSPLINMAIREMNRKQHQLAVWLIAIILCAMPTVFVWERDLITKGMDYTWFLALYIIAAYIRKYGIPKWMTMKVCIWTYVICSLITGGVRIPLGILSNHLGFGYTLSGLFFRYNSMLVAGASIALFCFFLQLRIREGGLNRLILQVAPLTFAVYLIHDHPLIRDLLWDSLPMHQWFTMGIPSTLVAMCVTVLIIFLFACLAEKGRIILFEKLGINNLLSYITQTTERMISRSL